MEEKLLVKQARRKMTGMGAALLIYYMIMTELVSLVMIVDCAIYALKHYMLN